MTNPNQTQLETNKEVKKNGAGKESVQRVTIHDEVTKVDIPVAPGQKNPGKQKFEVSLAESFRSLGPSTYTVVENIQTRVESTAPKPTDYVKIDEVIQNRFRVIGKLREGGYGQIYKVVDERSKREMVLKVERNDNTPNMEAIVMAKFSGCAHCPRIFAKGLTEKYRYVVMQLLGKNLNELRRMCPLRPPRMSCSASLRVTVQSIKATEGLHNTGFLHRDIKPSNFAMGCQESDQMHLYMLDYGLARYFLKKDGTVRPARDKAGFRGTVRYASINAHDNMELGRRDDLWSIFYSFFEIFMGELPWYLSNDRILVGRMKKRDTPESLCNWLPPEIGSFVKMVGQLNYEDKPDYVALISFFTVCLTRLNIQQTEPFDWQIADCKVMKHWTVAEDCKHKLK